MTTRFRLPSTATGSAEVSPATQSYTHGALFAPRIINLSDVSPLDTQATGVDGADHLVAGDTLLLQMVSRPMMGGIAFSTGDTVKYAIQGLESNAGNNLFIRLFIGVVSRDGSSAIATLRSKNSDATELATSLTNRTHSANLSGNHTTAQGERLVIEWSCEGTPSAAGGTQGHNASLRFGSDGTSGDLAENDTETGTTFNPWLEFSRDIFFEPLTGVVMPLMRAA